MRREIKEAKRARRHRRIRAKVSGTPSRPRLVVFRSNQHLYAQLINDSMGATLVSASDFEVKKEKSVKPLEIARSLGKILSEKAKEKGIQRVVFDRRGYTYHGRIRALADGARESGLQF